MAATRNVNSIRARLAHVKRWLPVHNPEFPAELFRELGYTSASVTQKSYDDVAILSRQPIAITSTTPGAMNFEYNRGIRIDHICSRQEWRSGSRAAQSTKDLCIQRLSDHTPIVVGSR